MSANSIKISNPRLLAWAAVCVYLVDVLLKQLALSRFQIGESGIAEFALFLNTGVAFSINLPKTVYWLAMLVATVALAWSFVVASRGRKDMLSPLTFIAFGALSNLTDRVMMGATVDYLIFFGRSAVNIADGMIVGGLLWLFWLEFKREREKII